MVLISRAERTVKHEGVSMRSIMGGNGSTRWTRIGLLALLVLTSVVSLHAQALPGWDLERLGDLSMPSDSVGFAMARSDTGDVYLFGGANPNGGGAWLTTIRRYTPATGTWEVLTEQLPYPYTENERHGATFASNGKAYLAPGNGPGGWGQNDQIIEVDPTAGTVRERAAIVAPGVRIWGCALAPAPASRGGVYLFGGWNGGGIATVRYYDPGTDQMSVKGSLSVGRTVGARVVHPNGRIYLFGGNTGAPAVYTAIDVFDTADESIRTIPNPDHYGFNPGTAGWVGSDGQIYLWNPKAAYLGASSDHIIRFDPETETLTDLGTTPLPGGWPVAAVSEPGSDQVYLFGLILPGAVWGVSGTVLAEVWKLSPGCTFGPEQPLVADRSAGKPAWEEFSWESCGGPGTLTIDGDDAASAVVYLNGTLVALPSDFDGRSTHLEIPVVLPKDANTLSVQVRGKPGGRLTFDLTE